MSDVSRQWTVWDGFRVHTHTVPYFGLRFLVTKKEGAQMIECSSLVPGERLLFDDAAQPTRIIYELPVEARKHYTHPRAVSYPLRYLLLTTKKLFYPTTENILTDIDRLALRGVLVFLMRNAPFRYEGVCQNGVWIHQTTPLQPIDPQPIKEGYRKQFTAYEYRLDTVPTVIIMLNYMVTKDKACLTSYMDVLNQYSQYRDFSRFMNQFYNLLAKLLNADEKVLHPSFLQMLLDEE